MLAALLFLTVTTTPALPPPDPYPALVARLEKPLVTKPETFRKLFLAMWAQVPNWKSGDPMWIRQPEPAWVPPPRVKGQPRAKRPPPHDPETLDWIAALQSVDLDAAAKLDSDKPIPPPWVPPGTKKKPAPPPPVAAVPPPPEPTHAEMEVARA